MNADAPHPTYEHDLMVAHVTGLLESVAPEAQRIILAVHQCGETAEASVVLEFEDLERRFGCERDDVLNALARGAHVGALTSYRIEGERVRVIRTPR